MNVAQETLGFRRAGLSPALSLLMSAFALPIPPARVTPHLRRLTERSSTTAAIPSRHSASRANNARDFAAPVMPGGTNVFRWIAAIRSFGYRLEPRYIFRAGRLDQ